VRMPKGERMAMLGSLLVALFVIQYLKMRSLTSCPWSLQEFGGTGRHVSHWLYGIADGASGHCFPAGHPSGALSFLVVPVYLLWHDRRWSYGILAIVLSAGAIWGTTQLVRGAHFVSHTLWTATICLAIAIVMRTAWGTCMQVRRASLAAKPMGKV
jgi:membrane-associated PAP2 superfamily phosphatase